MIINCLNGKRITDYKINQLSTTEIQFLIKNYHQDLKTAAYIYIKEKQGYKPNRFCPVCNNELQFQNIAHQYQTKRPQCCSRKCQFIQKDLTLEEKYGSRENFEKVQLEKRTKTFILRYGVSSYVVHPDFKNKSKATQLLNWGTESPQQNETVKNKIKLTNLKKFGVTQNLNLIHINPVQKLEASILEFVKSTYNGNIIAQTWDILKTHQIDIYIPDLKLGIEVNGDYWHSTTCGKDIDYHLNKTNLCEQKGIRLIHIWEHQWINNQEFCKKVIQQYLNNNIPLELFSNTDKLPRDYFQRLDFSEYEIKQPLLEKSGNFDVYKTGHLIKK